jgi:predicted AlkP superfamily pyrophosphatase or phosphodiesterase
MIFSLNLRITIRLFLILGGLCLAQGASALELKNWEQRPKLVVVLVIDQFRADYLTQYEKEFLPAHEGSKLGGFRYLMQDGAYFPFAEYPTFQCMTCSGHAMLLTGAPPAANGIPMNEWFDREAKKIIYCAEDEKGELTPMRLKTSTVGDELKLVHPKSKTVSLALKDRAAMMLAGHSGDIVVWFDRPSLSWKTSPYYRELPKYVEDYNKQMLKEKGKPEVFTAAGITFKSELMSKDSFSYGYGTRLTLQLAKEFLQKEDLGHHADPDLLTISLSNHDFLGHVFGFNSTQMHYLTVDEDRQISEFINSVKSHMKGLDDVVFVLSADHGIAPAVDKAVNLGLAAGKIDLEKLQSRMQKDLAASFGEVSKKTRLWVYGQKYFHYYVNPEALKEKKISMAEALRVMKKSAASTPGVLFSFGRDDYDKGVWPAGLIGEQLKSQYNPALSGDLVVIPAPFFMDVDDNHVTHITGYSYDRQVPLIITGRNVVAGVYSDFASVLDLAPTLSFMLGTVAPASSQGHVLPIFARP